MFKRLYEWTASFAQTRSAPWALAAVSFAESSFFPIPPDVLLFPMIALAPQRAWRYALICTIASVLGGAVGYYIGVALYESVGLWLIQLYGLGAKMEDLRQAYATYGAYFILLKGFTPIPYKIVTIFSGMMQYNFPLFLLLSAITRGGRFFVVAGVANKFSPFLNRALKENFGLFLLIVCVFMVGGVVAVFKLF